MPDLAVTKFPRSHATPDWTLFELLSQEAGLPLCFLSGPRERFLSGIGFLGWNEGHLLVAASLQDNDLVSEASRDFQHLWKLGDVFEIFLRGQDEPYYLELHVSPNGHRLQLQIPDSVTPRPAIGECLVDDESLFDFQTRHTDGLWEIIAVIPCAAATAGGRARVSLSRYDAGPDRAPVLSSTSRHAEVNFHRQCEWTPLLFVD
ncbi:hypothetical protein DB345_15170 [Spartobacteria bacterium LR76]|nr:hypothetical protein DB345_15170 [Spartobacteria bacterium LR76]